MPKTFLNLPHGLEVLIIKAAVDPEFKALLLARRAEAAGEIGLTLTAAEAAMLAAISPATLDATIAQTEVLPETRRVFLGKVAAAMLAALGVGEAQGCISWTAHGHRSATLGIQPEPPTPLATDPGPIRGILTDIPLGEPIYFDYDQAQLRPDQLPALERNLKLFEKYTRRGSTIIINGHTDERGTVEYNFALGQRRAQAVRDYLVRGGLPAEQLNTLSRGEEQPTDPGHTEAAWAKNRRVDFIRNY